MDLAKSLFGERGHVGYSGKDEHNKKVESALSEDESFYGNPEEDEGTGGTSDRKQQHFSPASGGPFSALTPSMWPQDILSKLGQNSDDPNAQPDYRFDEFGFRVEEEDGPEQSSSKLLSIPFIEDHQHRLKWITYLEFSHNDSFEITWENVDTTLPKTEKLSSMVYAGIPHSLRPQLWMRLSGAQQKKITSEVTYKDIVHASSNDCLMTSKQIEKDLLRTLPSNACFSHSTSTGIPRLRRVLRGLAWLYPDVGYCQGMGMIAASLLLLMEEEDAFWLMATIVENILPALYFSPTLLGVQADQRVLGTLVSTFLTDIDSLLREHDIELSLITLQWFLTLFSSVVHMKILLRIWDIFFFDGSTILFQITLGMLKLKEEKLMQSESCAQIFNSLSDTPGEIEDVECVLEAYAKAAPPPSLNNIAIETHRRRHLAYLMAEHGSLVGNPQSGSNLPKQRVNRRQLKKSKSLIHNLLFGDDSDEANAKTKNIKHTEILVDLRESILQVARHFMSRDPKLSKVNMIADYSMDSHSRDHEQFVSVSRNRRRRAKALLDFERHDDDELGFRKNDIITVVSQKDEHCWVGELNGLKGWFPAKFVELLDERSKQYSSAGDDSVSELVTDLVRGSLCPVIKAVLEHGMKNPNFLGGPCHPWLFIEEASTREVERDFNSVYSRLVLCKTYRLDEDGKVLTPEELLYRCVQSVNLTHDNAHAQMDVKLRSLVCLGLNEQVLHLWLEVLCSSCEVVQKWYHPWSFINSPGWVQIKCELRLLSQFAFNLNPDWELPPKKEQSQPLKEGVRDMLVKHHLFSWDL